MQSEILIKKISEFAAAHNIAPATVTSRAVGNSRLFQRLTNGGSCTLATAQRIQRYMRDSRRASGCPPQ